MGLKLAGQWISISERPEHPRVKFAKGLPALMAWRLLLLMGARALADETFNSLGVVLKEPIEVETLGVQFSYQPLPHRRDLFHPVTFLGHGDDAIRYIEALWENNPHLHTFFGSEEEFHFDISKFLMVIALADAKRNEGYLLYPGYRLLPQARRAMASLCGKLNTSETYLRGIAEAIGESAPDFKASWTSLAQRANSSKLGSGHWPSFAVQFPGQLGTAVEEW